MALIIGTGDGEVLNGTYNLADEIHGKGGNDEIFGNDGNDKIFGDNGQDSIYLRGETTTRSSAETAATKYTVIGETTSFAAKTGATT